MTNLELKNYQDAYRAWLKATDLNPKDEKSTYYLGRLFYDANLPEQAAAWLREALKINPDDFAATTYLGLCAEALNLDSTAEQLYRKAVLQSEDQRQPFAWAFLSLGNYLKKHGKESQAEAIFEQGARECPEAHELTALAELLASQGRTQRASDLLRQAISLDASLAQPHYRLALLLKSAGHSEASRAEMEIFQKLKAEEDKAPKILALRK